MSGGNLPANLLTFEAAWLNRAHDGRYEAAVRERFGTSITRHLQQINVLIDSQGAMEADPVTCRVLRERRAAKMRQRPAR